MNSLVENEIEEFVFLEIKNPYPIISTNYITTCVSLGREIDINLENIGIYYNMCNKINSKNNIHLEKFNDYSGNVIWYTSNQPNIIIFSKSNKVTILNL